MSLIAELKRRNVIRMAGLYLVGAWLVVQVAGTVLPMFGAPDWLARSIVIMLAIGFVPALAFAWVFELTPAGIKRDNEVDPTKSVAPQTAHRMNRLTIVVLMLAVVYFGVDKFVLAPQREAALVARTSGQAATKAGTAAPAAAANQKSIAVLPFENLSDDKANAYFASGMQDEILTRLAGIHDLKVISRTSTEQYASRPPNLKIVAEQLGVATVLEGSVQKANGKVRINLQLIDARHDSHLWAQNYDRDLKDVFAVQSDVADKVANALKAQLLPAESLRIASVPTQNQEAYDLFLQAKYLFNDQLQNSSAKDPVAVGKQAAALFQRAVAADPDFALAYAWLSYLQSYLHWYNVDNSPELVDAARDNAQKALALQPDLPQAHLAMGYSYYWGHRDYAAALKELTIARAGQPNNAEVVAAIAYVHRRQADADLGIPQLQQASLLDPKNSVLPREIAASYAMLRRYALSDTYYARSLAIFPDDRETQVQRATEMSMRGDTAAAERALAQIPSDIDPQGSVSLARFHLQMLLRQPDAALAAIAHAPDWLIARFEHSLVPVTLLSGEALAMKGEAGPARAAFLQAEQALQASLVNPVTSTDAHSFLGLAYAGLGRRQDALAAAREATDSLPISRDIMVGAYTLERRARVEAIVGATDSAITHLQQLLQAPAGSVVSVATLRIDPAWDSLRKDPRFQKLLVDAQAAQDKVMP